MLHDGDTVRLARTITRVPEANKWDKEALSKVNSTPWNLHQPRKPEVVFCEKADVEKMTLEDLGAEYVHHVKRSGRFWMDKRLPKV